MFEMFTHRARRAVVLAQEEARACKHDYIGTEHILLGLLHLDEGVAVKVLESIGISPEVVRQHVDGIIGQGQVAVSGHIPFTSAAKKVLEFSLRESLQLGHDHIGTEHIMLGLIRENDGVAGQVLVKLGADLDRTRQQVRYVLAEGIMPSTGRMRVLDMYTTDLTRVAAAEGLEPVVGRTKEIERVIQILTRRDRNLPLLVGERGVGKEAVVAGVVKAISSGDVPPDLSRRTVRSLDFGQLFADPQFRGRSIELVTKMLVDIRDDGTLVLSIRGFLTPLHLPDGTTNAFKLVQSLVGIPGIYLLGVSEQSEYDGRDVDAVFDRVTQLVPVEEPAVEDARVILMNVRQRLEQHHGVRITDSATERAITLARDHVPEQVLPGSAVDLLDEASALARVRESRRKARPAEVDQDGTKEGEREPELLVITESEVAEALGVYSGTASPRPRTPATSHRLPPAEHDPYVWCMS